MRSSRISELVLLVAVALVSAAVLAPRASGVDATYGHHFLDYGSCCNGDFLDGTSSRIVVNTSSPSSTACELFRSDAEWYDASGTKTVYLVQAGAVKCGIQTSLDGLCSNLNQLVLFDESYTPQLGHGCAPHGNLGGTGERFGFVAGVWSPDLTAWKARIDGTNYSEPTAITGDASRLLEGAEHTSTTSCSGWSGKGTWSTSGTGMFWWARYRVLNSTWVPVQGASTSSSCWTVTGGPPNSFTVSH